VFPRKIEEFEEEFDDAKEFVVDRKLVVFLGVGAGEVWFSFCDGSDCKYF
jgi:hypothetical protein